MDVESPNVPGAADTRQFSRAAADVSSRAEREIGQTLFSLIAVGVGIITGLGAILFRGLIGLIHNLFFLGRFSVLYDANLYTPASPWGAGIILVPVIGGMAVVFLV
jgi:CIC family chloride channel protein